MSAQKTIAVRKAAPTSRRHGAASLRALVVDDDPALLRAFTRMLQAAGFVVTSATDGRQALGFLAERSFNVVITDLMMPDIDGMGLLRAVHEQAFDVPVLLLTGKDDVAVAADALRYGAFAYLVKPIPMKTLRAAVRRAVKGTGASLPPRESIPCKLQNGDDG